MLGAARQGHHFRMGGGSREPIGWFQPEPMNLPILDNTAPTGISRQLQLAEPMPAPDA